MIRQEFIDHASSASIGRKRKATGGGGFLLPGVKRAVVSKRSLRLSESTTLHELCEEWNSGTRGSMPLSRLIGREYCLDLVDAKLFQLCNAVSEMVNRGSATGTDPVEMVNGLEQMRLAQGLTVEEFVNTFNSE